MTAFASVVLDADSTLASLEGIDWLARARGDEVVKRVAELTDEAMAGRIPLESVYARRLEIIRPTVAEIEALGDAYIQALAPGAHEAVDGMRRAGVSLRVVSGGIRSGLLPMTRRLGFADDEVRAVELDFDAEGRYAGVRPSPLTTQAGKEEVVRGMGLPRRILAVGDGSTDLAMRPAVDAFAAFVAFVRRPGVVEGADLEVSSFGELVHVVSGDVGA